MRGAGRTLLKSLNFNPKFFSSINSLSPTNGRPLQWLRHLAAAAKKPPSRVHDQENRKPESRTTRDSVILEMFRRRQGKGSVESGEVESEVACDGAGPTKVVSCFEELGLSREMVGAIGEMGIVVPSEVQCLGIPAVLEGKSLILIGPSESGRTWAYLLPLIQRLRKEAASFGLKRESPRAVVLCPSEEQCDKVFYAAKLITSHAKLKKSVAGGGLAGESGHKEDSSPAPIGMLVGTAEEILVQIENRDIILAGIRYLVLDEADIMLDSNFTEVHKIFSLLKSRMAEDPSFQTILIASTNEKMLGSELVESLERKESGKVTAIILEMDRSEVPSLSESPDALKKRVTEAVRSLAMAPSSS